MTLPKSIIDAIDAYRDALECSHDDRCEDLDTTVWAARESLEAAIAAAIQPPTDAEVEEWEQEARKVDLSVCTDCPGELYELRGEHLAKGIVLMRRARAPLERLRERVQKTIDVTPRSALLGMLLTVRDWIDEERGAGR